MNIRQFLSTTPNQPGIYQMLDKNNQVIYVGKARDLKKRLSSYFNKTQKDTKTSALLNHIHHVEIIVTRNENEALILESNLIKKLKPHYNVLFRDDKSYPYILITTQDTFPRIDLYRGALKSKGKFFGPYPNATAARETIHLIQKLFHLRTCSDNFFSNRKRPCLLHQIGRCTGPCVGLILPEEYQQNVQHAILFLEGKNDEIIQYLEKRMEKASGELQYEVAAHLRDQISQLRRIQEKQYVSTQEGDLDIIGFAKKAGLVCMQCLLIRNGNMLGARSYFPKLPNNVDEEEIISAFIAQHYLTGMGSHEVPKEILITKPIADQKQLITALSEQAKHKITITSPTKGLRKKWVDMANSSAKQVLSQRLVRESNMDERVSAIYDYLHLHEQTGRIECFDISHSMGEETVGSCVVFNRMGPIKNDYRRFNIKDVTPGDDIAATEQVLRRRYSKLDPQKIPDIVLIDGGKTQLHAAEKILTEFKMDTIYLIGVAKGPTRKAGYETLHQSGKPPINLPSDSLVLHLIQQIRDEAHRFAITGHRLRRDKKRRTSVLESIPGIGPKRRRELLRYFGGIQGLTRASLEELSKVPGVSQPLAERIFASLRNLTVDHE